MSERTEAAQARMPLPGLARRDDRFLIVGECPGPATDPGDALHGGSGRALARVAGVGFGWMLERYERRNVLGYHAERWTRFDREQARRQAEFLRQLWNDFDGVRVALLGRRVAAAFGLPRRAEYLSRHALGGGDALLVPHPSGVNRWWNDEGNRAAAREVLREFLLLDGAP